MVVSKNTILQNTFKSRQWAHGIEAYICTFSAKRLFVQRSNPRTPSCFDSHLCLKTTYNNLMLHFANTLETTTTTIRIHFQFFKIFFWRHGVYISYRTMNNSRSSAWPQNLLPPAWIPCMYTTYTTLSATPLINHWHIDIQKTSGKLFANCFVQSPSGLPDFSQYNILKLPKIDQMAIKLTKWP
jgi:hypothetical protein